jgi:hypothetical protein
MKNLVLTFVGVLLVAVSTVSLSKTLNSHAATAKRLSQPRVAGLPKTAKLKQGWRLGAPVRHENLTIFPVLSDEAGSTDEFITLDAGLRSGKVKVTEMKGGTRRVTRRPQVNSNRAEPQTSNAQRNIAVQEQVAIAGDGAEVNKVLVTNNSGKTLVLIAGEFILGGKQDRIVGHDCIVSSTNTPVSIDVFCVEHGRWQASDFGRSRSGAGSGGGSSDGNLEVMGFAAAPGVMAAPNVRANAQAKKSQSEVWSEVADKVAKNHVSTSTGTLNSVYSDKKVSARLNDYQRAINAGFADKNVIGAVVAINGKLLSADVFASPQLFQAYQAKLLKSYALEAISAEKVKTPEVKASDAEAFLSASEGAESAVEKDGVYRLAEKQSGSDASFELVHTNKSARLIHFNRVTKK